MKNKMPMMHATSLGVALSLLGIVAGCQANSSRYSATLETARVPHIVVCSGYDCHYRDKLPVSAADAAHYAAIMARGAASPQAERAAVADAVQYFEQRSIQMLGVRDVALSQFSNFQERGQMDCIDESTNTQSLLYYLEAHGLLRHHTVEQNAARGFMIDITMPHATAVLKDRAGVKWSIDSWEKPGGSKPDIMPLAAWVRNGGLSEALFGKV